MIVEARPEVYPFAELVASLNASSPADGPKEWTSSLVVDFNAVEHWRSVGYVESLDEEPMPIQIIRRDEFDLTGASAAVLRGEAFISLAGTRFDAQGCREFSRLLAATADELQSVNAAA